MVMDAHTRIAAEDYLEALAAQGIEHLFVNPGTDFAPVIEAFARAARSNRQVPKPMVVPHENAAVCMAHGYTAITGRPQAVMTHVNVGLANTLNALIDASRDRIPMLLTSGRTPITEQGAQGSRNVYIHWAQEMFDQAGMLREVVKWDYELRRPDQIADVVSRALEIATASPTGPVYLSLPREVLGEPVGTHEETRPPRARPRPPLPAPADVEQLADWIATARMPLVITGTLGRDPRESVALARLADQFALAVVPFNTRYFALSSADPMFQGSAPGTLLQEADLVLVWETDVPWYPAQESPAPGARVVQIGEDPLYARYPMRSFPSDLTIRSATLPLLEALEPALAARKPDTADRHARLSKRSADLRAGWAAEAERDGRGATCTLAWLNHCLRDVVDQGTIVVNEYLLPPGVLPPARPRKPAQHQFRRRSRLGPRLRARRQARRPRPQRGRGAGRRRLHVRQPHGVPLRRRGAKAAGADGDLQQRLVWRGPPGDARHVRARGRGRKRRAPARRSRPGAGLRADRGGAWRPRRAGRAPGRPTPRAPPRGCRRSRRPAGPSQRALPALTPLRRPPSWSQRQ